MMYRVVWECDIDAATPEAAALEAESIMHDYASDGHRPVLDVYRNVPLGASAYADCGGVEHEQIDLEETDG